MADSFKSVQHSLNYQNMQLQKKNKKQAAKVYTKEELQAFAASRGMTVSEKPVQEVVAQDANEIELDEEIDYSALPAEVLALIGRR